MNRTFLLTLVSFWFLCWTLFSSSFEGTFTYLLLSSWTNIQDCAVSTMWLDSFTSCLPKANLIVFITLVICTISDDTWLTSKPGKNQRMSTGHIPSLYWSASTDVAGASLRVLFEYLRVSWCWPTPNGLWFGAHEYLHPHLHFWSEVWGARTENMVWVRYPIQQTCGGTARI